MLWVIQSNLGKEEDIQDLYNAVWSEGYRARLEKAIPFSEEVPDVPNDQRVIFYGATNWINEIYKRDKWYPGAFFNPESIFTLWNEKYGKHSLNYGADITTLEQFDETKYDEEIFVRPVSDQKEFAGTVIKSREIREWADKLQTDVPDFAKTPIVVAKTCGISNEWRLFMVDGKVSSGSRYRQHHKLSPSADIPHYVTVFAEERAMEYSPCPVFVMDIGQSANLYVIEIGCFNSAGWYSSDIQKIVKDVSEYCISKL